MRSLSTVRLIELVKRELAPGGYFTNKLKEDGFTRDNLVVLFSGLRQVTDDLTRAHNAPVGTYPELEKYLIRDRERVPGMVKLTITNRDGNPTMGNGFFLQHEGRYYLVTARHCINGSVDADVFISVNFPGSVEDYAFFPVDPSDVPESYKSSGVKDSHDLDGSIFAVIGEKNREVIVSYGIPVLLNRRQLEMLGATFKDVDKKTLEYVTKNPVVLVSDYFVQPDGKGYEQAKGRSGSEVFGYDKGRHAYVPAGNLTGYIPINTSLIPSKAFFSISDASTYQKWLQITHALSSELQPKRLSSLKTIKIEQIDPSLEIVSI